MAPGGAFFSHHNGMKDKLVLVMHGPGASGDGPSCPARLAYSAGERFPAISIPARASLRSCPLSVARSMSAAPLRQRKIMTKILSVDTHRGGLYTL